MIDAAELQEIAFGALGAAVAAVLLRALARDRERAVYAVGLVGAALVYVLFAALGGAAPQWIGLELFGVALFAIPAALGFFVWRGFLALGWGAHALWDAVPHTLVYTGYVPEWYPGACLGFDLLLAAWLSAGATAALARRLSQRLSHGRAGGRGAAARAG